MRYGLIGEKLGHSFSKEIHESIADYTYDLIPLEKDEFRTFMETKAFDAINVTIPYKKDVIPYLDEIDQHARAIGAVNTIVNRNGKLCGYNTDFSGFLYMVKKHDVNMAGKKVLVIGNGGASAAIQAAVRHEKAGEMIIVDIREGGGAISYDEMYEKHMDAQIIINTSPIGMYPNIDASPVDISAFHSCETIMDVIYNPLITKIAADGKRHGTKRVNGLEMLIAQAKYAVEFFLDKRVDDSVIDTIYERMLKERVNIVLIGMPSCGKTTIGKALAQTMNKEFVDMDDVIIGQANRSIPEIFAAEGEEGFRAREHEAAKQLAGRNNLVIATGGGCIKNKKNMELLAMNGVIVFVDRSLDKLICTDTNRPLSKSREALSIMLEERLPLYRRYAMYHADNNADMQTCIQDIETAYNTLINHIKG